MATNKHSIKGYLGSVASIQGVGAGGVLDFTELSAKTEPIVADSIPITDSEDSDAPKKVTITNIAKATGERFAGTVTSSSLSETDGVGRVNIGSTSAKTTPVAADSILVNDSEDTNSNKKVTFTNAAKALAAAHAGTVTSSALTGSAATGALAVSPGGATAKTAPVIADLVLVCDTEDSNANKSVTVGNLTKALGISAVTAKTEPVVADAVLINDSADSNKAKSCTITNLSKATGERFAGTNTASSLSEADGVGRVNINGTTAKNTPVGADALLVNDSEDSNTNKKTTITQLASRMAGSGLDNTAEVINVVDVGIAHCLADDKHSIFFIQGEMDYGESNAVTADLGALGAKATLVGGYWYTTEATANGDATNVITLGSATGGGTPIAGTRTITTANTGDGQSNVEGAMAAVIPVAAGIDMASTDHVWLDVPDDAAGTRSAGKIAVFLIFQKSA